MNSALQSGLRSIENQWLRREAVALVTSCISCETWALMPCAVTGGVGAFWRLLRRFGWVKVRFCCRKEVFQMPCIGLVLMDCRLELMISFAWLWMAALIESMNWQLLTFPNEMLCVTDRDCVESTTCAPPSAVLPIAICCAFQPGTFPRKTRSCSPGAIWHISKSPLRTQLMELAPLVMVTLSTESVPERPRKQIPSWFGPSMKLTVALSCRLLGLAERVNIFWSFQVTQPTCWAEVVETAQSSCRVQSWAWAASSRSRRRRSLSILIQCVLFSNRIQGDRFQSFIKELLSHQKNRLIKIMRNHEQIMSKS